MIQRKFLHMMGHFLDVSEKIQHTTPSQFEQMIRSPPNELLQQLFFLEQEIQFVRQANEQYIMEKDKKVLVNEDKEVKIVKPLKEVKIEKVKEDKEN